MASVETRTLPARSVVAPPSTAPPKRPRRGRRGLAGFLFTTPFLAGFAMVFVIPFVYALYQSVFTERKSGLGLGGSETRFAGLDNFARGTSDPVFWEGVVRVVVFAAV